MKEMATKKKNAVFDHVQWLAKKLVIWAFYLIKWLFSTKNFDL